jgi:acyl dehydratase
MPVVEELAAPPRLGPLFRSAVLRTSVGATLPDTELVLRGVRVDRDHLAAYGRVCGFRLRDELPATYPHVLAFPLALSLMARPAFPLPLLGLVHVANRIDVLRPVTAAETLDFRVLAERLRPHERGTQVDVVATALVDDEPVWLGRSTYLRRDRSAASTGGDRPPPADPSTPSAVVRVERRVGPDYAAVSGDRNPIHTSRVLARAFGFRRTIAHGMWSKARCLAALEGRLPDAYGVEVAFKLPILLPATVALRTERDGAGWRLALHDAKSGKPHLTGTVQPAEASGGVG